MSDIEDVSTLKPIFAYCEQCGQPIYGEIDPIMCETCDWCKRTKVLTDPIYQNQLLGEA